MELQDAIDRARTAAYEPNAAVDWDLINAAASDLKNKGQAGVLINYIEHHLPVWYRVAKVECVHPWSDVEAQILARADLPLAAFDKNSDPVRVSCAAWKAVLDEIGDEDEDARWKGWLCTWVIQ